MKIGSERMYQLESFFKTVKENKAHKFTIQKTKEIEWIKIFEYSEEKLIFGISQNGEWVFKLEDKFYILNTTTILFTTPVLVLSYDYIKKDIEKNIMK